MLRSVISTMLCVANESRFGDCTNFSFKRNSINESSHPLCLGFGEVWFLLKLVRVGKFGGSGKNFLAFNFTEVIGGRNTHWGYFN